MQFASLVSQFTEPMIIVMLLVVLSGWQAGLRGMEFVWFITYLVLISLAVWIARLRLVKSLHTNWDVSDRPKRVRLLILLLGFSVVVFSSFFLFQNARLVGMSAQFFLWLLGFFLITLRTKISGHLAVFTLGVGYLMNWYGLLVMPLVFLLPLVGWSRLILKRHTLIEVVGGIAYSVTFLLVAHWIS